MNKKKCDICKTQEKKEEIFMPIFRETTQEYSPKEGSLIKKVIYRTKQVFVCPYCYLVRINKEELKR